MKIRPELEEERCRSVKVELRQAAGETLCDRGGGVARWCKVRVRARYREAK
jgi:hypothetical protein